MYRSTMKTITITKMMAQFHTQKYSKFSSKDIFNNVMQYHQINENEEKLCQFIVFLITVFWATFLFFLLQNSFSIQ